MMQEKQVETPTAEKMAILDSIYQNFNQEASIMIYLQKVQAELGYVPEYAVQYLARKTNTSESHMFGVLTFYSQFSLKPVGKNIIKICNGTACHVGGSKLLSKKLRQLLKVNEENPTTEDMLFTVQNVACLGCCALAPAMMVNDKVYGSLTEDKVREIVEDYRKAFENKVV